MVVVLSGVGWDGVSVSVWQEGEEDPVGRFFARGLAATPTTDRDPTHSAVYLHGIKSRGGCELRKVSRKFHNQDWECFLEGSLCAALTPYPLTHPPT